MTSETCSFE